MYFKSKAKSVLTSCMLSLQSIYAEERWNGASFGSILRSRDHDASSNENILSISLVLSSTKSKIKQVEYVSLLLQVHWLTFLQRRS